MPLSFQPAAVVVREDAALADQQAVGRHHRRQPLRGFEAGFECPEIAVVDADQPRRQFQRALHFGLVMHFDQRIHAEFESRRFQVRWPWRRRRWP